MINPFVIRPVPTIGDKIRSASQAIAQLKVLRAEAVEDRGAAEARIEAIDAHLAQAEERLITLEEQDLDERYGVPS